MSSIRERQLRAKGIDPDKPQGGLSNQEWNALDYQDRENHRKYQQISNLRTDLNTARSGTSDTTVLRETPVVNSVVNQSQDKNIPVVSSQEILDNIEVVEDWPSRTEGDTKVYASKKVDGKALMNQLKAENEASELNNVIRDRMTAIEFSSKNLFINSGPFEREKYFENLSTHKYMLCPLGNGMQSPKIIEAILNCCIPVMTDNITSRRLIKKGFPILIVNEWAEINEKKLNENYDRLETEIKVFREKVKDLDKWWNFSFDKEK